MRIKSIEKVATVYFYVETDEELFPMYRRSEGGHWERSQGESWEAFYDEGAFEEAFQNYLAGQPVFDLKHFKSSVPIEDGVYHIEYIDSDHVRLTRKAP